MEAAVVRDDVHIVPPTVSAASAGHEPLISKFESQLRSEARVFQRVAGAWHHDVASASGFTRNR